MAEKKEIVGLDDEKAVVADKTTCTIKASPIDFRSMRDKYTDVILKVGDKTFNAHRLVLARHSIVFEKMLLGSFLEKSENAIPLEDAPDTFKYLLDYIYGEELKVLLDDLHVLHHLADKYDVKELKSQCHESLKKAINKDNVDTFYLHVKEFDPELTKHCRTIMILSFNEYNAYQNYVRFKDVDPELTKECMDIIFENIDHVIYHNNIDQKDFFALMRKMNEDVYSGFVYEKIKLWRKKFTGQIDEKELASIYSELVIDEIGVNELLTDETLRNVFKLEDIFAVIVRRYKKIPRLGTDVTLDGAEVTVTALEVTSRGLNVNYYDYMEHNDIENFFYGIR